MQKTLKVVIPMAGLGTRLRPHTWSKPKQLVGVAGKAMIDHVIDSLSSLEGHENFELINIVGYLGDQIEAYLGKRYPEIKAHYVFQEDPRGQSHAIQLAGQYLDGPMLVVFADTLIETDLSNLGAESVESIAWVKSVLDPRRFGVVVLDEDEWVVQIVEKPQEIISDLAVVGFYYFREAADLLAAIDEQMRRKIELKGEFYLADAINIMLERGLKMRVEKVQTWLDAGTPEALLETNRYLLEHGLDNSAEAAQQEDAVIVPPVFIHPSAQIDHSIIGPHVSIGAGCKVVHSIISDSILEDEAEASSVILDGSWVGRQAQISRRAGIVNAGDNSVVKL